MTIQSLKEVKEEKCEVAVGVSITGGDAHMETKEEYINRILQEQHEEGHLLHQQANYIVCQKCGMRTLRNAAREKIQQMHQSTCWYGPWTPDVQWQGSPTHRMWRRGQKIYCQSCNGHAINHEKGWKASRQLQRVCAAGQQTQLPLCFRAKAPIDEA